MGTHKGPGGLVGSQIGNKKSLKNKKMKYFSSDAPPWWHLWMREVWRNRHPMLPMQWGIESVIDLQGIITDQVNLYPGHFHFFYKITIICVNDMATQSSTGSSSRRSTGSSSSEKQDLCCFLPWSRGKHWDKQRFLLSGNKYLPFCSWIYILPQ